MILLFHFAEYCSLNKVKTKTLVASKHEDLK